tara:strand:- start:1900 stop:2280 length:381 start_codon:yes stop_codon:yes gene_type:complete
MISSTLFLGMSGAILTFLPNEIISSMAIRPSQITTLFFQLTGALYLGFAMLNWMAKGTLIGGIYNKPIAIGNLMHFGVGAIALIKIIFKILTHKEIVIALAAVYVIFAILFAYVLRTNPTKTEKNK